MVPTTVLGIKINVEIAIVTTIIVAVVARCFYSAAMAMAPLSCDATIQDMPPIAAKAASVMPNWLNSDRISYLFIIKKKAPTFVGHSVETMPLGNDLFGLIAKTIRWLVIGVTFAQLTPRSLFANR